MDNITHSLIGIVAAESAFHLRYKKVPERKTTHNGRAMHAYFWLASIVANNFPDLDFIYTSITPGRLGSLLHHRGHTHTVAFAFLQAILVYFFTLLVARRRGDDFLFTRSDRFALFSISLAGLLLHIFADSWNAYGVHPFWPISNAWMSMDSVFIVEPWIWVTFTPIAFFACRGRTIRSKIAKGFHALVFVGAIALSFGTGYVPFFLALALVAWALVYSLNIRKLSESVRSHYAIACLGIFLGIMAYMSTSSSHLVRERLKDQMPGLAVKDVIMSPMPFNPFCYYTIAIGVDSGNYILLRAMTAPAPEFIKATGCPMIRSSGQTTAPLGRSPVSDTDSFVTLGMFKAPQSEFMQLKQNCQFEALLRFARAPFWVREGKSIIAGDLRFDREKGLGWTEIEINPESSECPKNLPPWQHQRNDI